MPHVVDVGELQPVRRPSGITMGQHDAHVGKAVEDPGRHERERGIRHGWAQARGDAGHRRTGRRTPERVVDAHRDTRRIDDLPEPVVTAPGRRTEGGPCVEDDPPQAEILDAAQQLVAGIVEAGHGYATQADETIRAVRAELGDPVVVGPYAAEDQLVIRGGPDGVPETGKRIQDLGRHPVGVLGDQSLRRIVQRRQDVLEAPRAMGRSAPSGPIHHRIGQRCRLPRDGPVADPAHRREPGRPVTQLRR